MSWVVLGWLGLKAKWARRVEAKVLAALGRRSLHYRDTGALPHEQARR
jgi:hypothetical protein